MNHICETPLVLWRQASFLKLVMTSFAFDHNRSQKAQSIPLLFKTNRLQYIIELSVFLAVTIFPSNISLLLARHLYHLYHLA